MAARTGTASDISIAGGDGSTSVTVPAGATAVVAFWGHWDGGAGSTLATLTLNGVGFTFEPGQVTETGTTTGTGCATLVSPATGTQTVAWTFSGGGARSDGGRLFLVYVNAVDTGSLVRDSAIASTDGADLSVIVDSTTTDLVLSFCVNWAAPALSGTVFINNSTSISLTFDVAEQTAGASTTTTTMTGESYPGMASVSLRNSGGGGGLRRRGSLGLVGVGR